MLSKVLEKSTCAECRFCCSFRRCSLWETPLFPKDTMDKLENEKQIFKRIKADITDLTGKVCSQEYGQMDLLYKYKTEDSEEEAACEFLDSKKGCVLSEEDKPFDCKIWPLRIMKRHTDMGEQIVIALTPTCPSINKVPLEQMKELVQQELGDIIYQYAKKYPFIVKEYKEDFPILKIFQD